MTTAATGCQSLRADRRILRIGAEDRLRIVLRLADGRRTQMVTKQLVTTSAVERQPNWDTAWGRAMRTRDCNRPRRQDKRVGRAILAAPGSSPGGQNGTPYTRA